MGNQEAVTGQQQKYSDPAREANYRETATESMSGSDSNKDTKCFLTSIAPELRNAIYIEVFKTPAEASLLGSSPPQKALLLTCRAIYEEAMGTHRLAYRRYWSETAFSICALGTLHSRITNAREPNAEMYAQLNRIYRIHYIDEQDLGHITKLRVETAGENDLSFKDGIWHWTARVGGLPLTLLAVPRGSAKTLRGNGYAISAPSRYGNFEAVDIAGLKMAEMEVVKSLFGNGVLTQAALLAMVIHAG